MKATPINEHLVEKCELVERDSSKLPKGILARVWYPIMRFNVKNANNRKYSKAVAEAILNDDDVKKKLETRTLYGNQEHPAESALKLNWQETSHILSEFKMDENILHAAFDILPTEPGKFINILLEAGCLVGVSTRADGELEEAIDEDGSTYHNVVPKAYRFKVADFTGDPSTPDTVPESIISSVQNHYEAHDINKNVAIALLERVQTEASRALEKIIKEDKQHKDCKCKLGDKKCGKGCEHSIKENDDPREILLKRLVDLGVNDQKAYMFALDVGGNLGWPDDYEDQQAMLEEYEISSPQGVDAIIEIVDEIFGNYMGESKLIERIKKIGPKQWRLYSKDGSKNLGTFGSLAAAKKHEGEVQYFKTHEAKTNEELTTSSDTSGQPANLAASKEDMENSKKRGEEVDRKLDDVSDQPVESKMEEVVNNADISLKIKAFLDDNWSLFLRDVDLLPNGDPNSKKMDAIKNVSKVFKLPIETATQYVNQLAPQSNKLSAVRAMSNEKVEPSDSPILDQSTRLAAVIAEKELIAEQLKQIKESYSNDAIRFANEIDSLTNSIKALKEDRDTIVKHYSNDSIHFAKETSSLKEKISKLDESVDVKRNLLDNAVQKTLEQYNKVRKLTEEKDKIVGELNEKLVKLSKEIIAKESAIRGNEKEIKLLQENYEKEIKVLNEAHSKEKINLYVDYRVKSMGLKLHENVLTLLRQSKSNNQVDILIRETQDALREGLTQSVNKISEVVVERPIDKTQADINDKVGIALKHFTGL